MSGSHEHYFTGQPSSEAERRSVSVDLAGQRLSVQVASGIFSPAGIDRGTTVLLRHVPPPAPNGTFLDLGCGWGPIALTLALRAPHAQVWAVDVNERALDLMRRNAAALVPAPGRVHVVRPDEVPPAVSFDLIWCNPAIRIGKPALHEMLRAWLGRLVPGGSAYLVVGKDLGADSLQKWLGDDGVGPGYAVRRIATDKGFRVIQVSAPQP